MAFILASRRARPGWIEAADNGHGMTALRDRTAGRTYDAIVVGAGPNGLAAALTLARAGRSVLLLEAAETVGGGARTAELTLPGFRHDVCSAIHPLAVGSPFFRTAALADHGVEWIQPPLAAAHPLDDGSAGAFARSLDETARTLGPDGNAWRRLFGPLAERWDMLAPDLLGPILHVPRHPLALARFGLRALWPAATLARTLFRTEKARALFAGLAAHAIMPLEQPLTAAFGLVLGMTGHAVGWPLPRGGSQTHLRRARLARARARRRDPDRGAGHDPWTTCPRRARSSCDVAPRRLLAIAGDRLHGRYRRRLERYRHGPGVFKVDAALDGPIPWRAAECAQSGDGARRRDPGRGRGRGGRGVARRAPGAAVRARRPAEPFRPDPGAGRKAHALGLLPRAERVQGRHDRADPRPDRALRARLPGADPGRLHATDPPRWRPTTRTTSAETSPGGRRASTSCSDGPRGGSVPTPLLPAASTSAPRRRLRAAACTACAATWPPRPLFATSSSSARRCAAERCDLHEAGQPAAARRGQVSQARGLPETRASTKARVRANTARSAPRDGRSGRPATPAMRRRGRRSRSRGGGARPRGPACAAPA